MMALGKTAERARKELGMVEKNKSSIDDLKKSMKPPMMILENHKDAYRVHIGIVGQLFISYFAVLVVWFATYKLLGLFRQLLKGA